MSYETWESANTIAILVVVIAPVVLAVVVALILRQRRDAEGKRIGRALLWSFVTAFFSFLALVIVWSLALQEAFPEYSSRWRAEDEQQYISETATENRVIDEVTGRWRPNNANRTDYFTFTSSTYSSVNPAFDTTISYRYRVLRRDGPCMRIETIGSQVIQAGEVTEASSRTGEAFIVCVDPETDQMLMRFNDGVGDVLFTRMD